MSTDQHKPGKFYWEAGSDKCPHGTEPDPRTAPEAWDTWYEHHTESPLDITICLDAPAGQACIDCSEVLGSITLWSACQARDHAVAVSA